MTSMLAGLKVVDFTSMMAGPLCTRYLADLGAEVTKVEEPGGDYMRSRPPLREGRSAYFAHLNAGKASVVIDLKTEEGLAQARRLVGAADIVVESFRPGVMARLGLDYDTVRAGNERVVYCSISGFGQTGPSAQRPAYAQVVHAVSGYDRAFMSYQEGQEKPANSVLFVADALAASHALSAILAALHQRARDGKGHHVDVSLLEGMLNLMVYEIQAAQFPVERPRAKYEPMATADGFILVAPTTPKNFENVCRAIGRPDMLEDPRFATVEDRYAHWDALMAAIGDWTAGHSTQACEEVLCAAGVPCGRYNSVADALRDPQVEALQSMATTHDASGPVKIPRLPFRLDGVPVAVGAHVPELGTEAPVARARTSAKPQE
ncbi:CaiB/BaiF CoA transferase family protein [Acuticoccus mangrovi]|uniref:CoA transferase n=1 Tax=Acuticoccus mangrovi TaxID=2796142 RepID=A0A934MFD3_9HYPH|nr:CoA transferase [Acuticoccus mangrovi]MBJ3775348.1 CoA transferase [Acuticoccus mangrovi]